MTFLQSTSTHLTGQILWSTWFYKSTYTGVLGFILIIYENNTSKSNMRSFKINSPQITESYVMIE